MPRPLPQRFAPETPAEFLAAADERFRDGVALAAASRRAGAVYVWGYVAEMVLKASYFRLLGSAAHAPVTRDDLLAARALGRSVGFVWPPGENLHYLPGWAELIVQTRLVLPASRYLDPTFAAALVGQTRVVWTSWRETMRYHKNVASEREAAQVRTAIDWLRANQVWI